MAALTLEATLRFDAETKKARAAVRKIVVLDGTDVAHPEDLAMLQALYSRSPRSVVEHLEKVRKVGSGQFMGQYYTG